MVFSPFFAELAFGAQDRLPPNLRSAHWTDYRRICARRTGQITAELAFGAQDRLPPNLRSAHRTDRRRA
ncbi:MAG: hypothetical protein IKR81_14400, partial [Victivallales bacterium]|nr:hypothetical protein [Victivallales bacterium]